MFIIICQRFSEFYEIFTTHRFRLFLENSRGKKIRIQLFECFVELYFIVDRDTFDPIATHVVTRYTCSTFNVERTSRKANRASGRLRGN